MFELTPLLAYATSDDGNLAVAIADKMGVNWPKFLSSVILFLAVAFSLLKLAYGPVLKILDQRRAMIDKTLEDAERVKLELAEAEASRREILKKAEMQAAEIVKQGQASAESLAQRRTQDAIKEAEQIIIKGRQALQLEKDRMEAELRREIVRLVADATQRVTGKILTPEDHQRLNQETLSQVARN